MANKPGRAKTANVSEFGASLKSSKSAKRKSSKESNRIVTSAVKSRSQSLSKTTKKQEVGSMHAFPPMQHVDVIRNEEQESFLQARLPSLHMKSALKDRSEAMTMSRATAMSTKTSDSVLLGGRSTMHMSTRDKSYADIPPANRCITAKCMLLVSLVASVLIISVGLAIYFLFLSHKDDDVTKSPPKRSSFSTANVTASSKSTQKNSSLVMDNSSTIVYTTVTTIISTILNNTASTIVQ